MVYQRRKWWVVAWDDTRCHGRRRVPPHNPCWWVVGLVAGTVIVVDWGGSCSPPSSGSWCGRSCTSDQRSPCPFREDDRELAALRTTVAEWTRCPPTYAALLTISTPPKPSSSRAIDKSKNGYGTPPTPRNDAIRSGVALEAPRLRVPAGSSLDGGGERPKHSQEFNEHMAACKPASESSTPRQQIRPEYRPLAYVTAHV